VDTAPGVCFRSKDSIFFLCLCPISEIVLVAKKCFSFDKINMFLWSRVGILKLANKILEITIGVGVP
jgi:hypothetical protein